MYLIGIKENQQELLEETKLIIRLNKPAIEHCKTEKDHGRIDTRSYAAYTLNNPYLDQRWEDANFQTIIKVERTSINTKTEIKSSEISYYITNQKITITKNDFELFDAIRRHWNVEVNNYIRDVTLKEDQLKTKEPLIARNLAICRTLLLNLLYQLKLKNIKAKLEEFAHDFQILINWLKEIKFL